MSQTRPGRLCALEAMAEEQQPARLTNSPQDRGSLLISLRSANRELQQLRQARDEKPESRAKEAEILEGIARTHASLSEPLGAVRNALLAAEIRRELQDEVGEATALLLAADQQRNLGEMIDATETAERALQLAQKTGTASQEAEASKALSRILGERGLYDKAPQRPDALQTLEALVAAVKARDGVAAKEAEQKINSYGALVTDKDIADHIVPLISRDPEATTFLREELGWDLEKPYTQKQNGMEVRHLDFYLAHRLTGMGFGPQFKVCNMPVRVTGSYPVTVSVNQLPETEAWQMEMMYRPGFLDSGLQSGFVMAPFFDK
ncbi:hypothetical protein AK812_SmicGene11571 [Symbiodinium microadriaticum]|uniref:Uncharacterized protein n=1 Tax=Symbiodinium microadriaticum TaxID=2951 RepID=A0A1Q9ECV0_SYMMI|nr:hypothetical protein AK812_SmicGene11571 [Symbiodinium microadriaticum]